MGPNVMFFAWGRPVVGRETMSAEHFAEFVAYLDGLKRVATIESYDVVFLDHHGGDIEGFFLIRGAPAKLDALAANTDWLRHMARASMHLQGMRTVRGHTGSSIPGMMEIWSSAIPS